MLYRVSYAANQRVKLQASRAASIPYWERGEWHTTKAKAKQRVVEDISYAVNNLLDELRNTLQDIKSRRKQMEAVKKL